MQEVMEISHDVYLISNSSTCKVGLVLDPGNNSPRNQILDASFMR